MNPIEQAEHKVTEWFHHDKENTVTETNQAPAGTADAPAVPFWSALHQNLAVFTSRVDSFLPKIARIADAAATNPVLDDVVEAALAAAGMGTAEEVFAGIVALLKAHPEDAESAAFDLLKTVMHQSGKPSAAAAPGLTQQLAANVTPGPGRPSFTPAPAGNGTQTAQAAKPLVV